MSCSRCNCNPCSCATCDPNNESAISIMNNMVANQIGEVTKTCENGVVIWALPCNLDIGADDFPRLDGESIDCYFLRYMEFLQASIPGAVTFPIEISQGGTGQVTAAAARTALGLAIGSDVEAWSALLDSWAAITRAAGFDTFAATPSSANLAALVTGETGSGALVFGTAPTIVEPVLTNVNNTMQTLTDAATIAWDCDLGAIATVALTANRAMGAPTNMHPGTYILITTGAFAITSWNAIFDWGSGAAPTGGGTKNVYSFVYNGTKFTGAAVTSVA